MRDIRIRSVLPEDIDVCHRIEAACFDADEAATRGKILRRQQLFPEGFLIAEKKGQVIGFINSGATNKPDLADEAFKDLDGHESGGKHMVILSLAVHPEYQGYGISRLLLESFMERCIAMSRASILLLCKEHLLAYYEKFGFQDLGESASAHGGSRWHEMRLEIG